MKKPPARPNYWTAFADLLPRKWTRIGHPIPVPGGFVFIVGMPIGGRIRYPINRYVAAERKFVPVLNLAHRAIVLDNSRDARLILTDVAQTIEADEED